MEIILTGFHAIDEAVKAAPDARPAQDFTLFYAGTTGPRVKKILNTAAQKKLHTKNCERAELDRLVEKLPEALRNHRGLVLVFQQNSYELSLEQFLAEKADAKTLTVAILSNIIDPHNVGAILRSAEQFAVDAVITAERKSAGDYATIAKISSGASALVPLIRVKNLNRATDALKAAGFWLYGADLDGDALPQVAFAARTCIVLGSEGSGIAAALKRNCDTIITIPTYGKLDSLNVSNAAAVIFYARSLCHTEM